MNPSAHHDRPTRYEVVAAPRVTDAIGRALRGAFGTAGLPDDMRLMLDQLDRSALSGRG